MAFTAEELIIDIRLHAGGLSTKIMSDELMTILIDRVAGDYSYEDEDKCLVTFHSLLAVLNYLNIQSKVASGGSTAEIRRREKNNKREIELEYTENSTSGYEYLLSYFKEHPEVVCKSLVAGFSGQGLVHIGGVSKKDVRAVNRNRDSNNAYQETVQNHFDRKTTNHIRGRGRIK